MRADGGQPGGAPRPARQVRALRRHAAGLLRPRRRPRRAAQRASSDPATRGRVLDYAQRLLSWRLSTDDETLAPPWSPRRRHLPAGPAEGLRGAVRSGTCRLRTPTTRSRCSDGSRHGSQTKLDDASDVVVRNLAAPGESGFSSETMLFDATWTANGSRAEASVRPPHPTDRPRRVPRVRPRSPVRRDLEGGRRGARRAAPAAAMDGAVGPSRSAASSSSMDRVDGLVPPDNLPYTMGGWLLRVGPRRRSGACQRSGHRDAGPPPRGRLACRRRSTCSTTRATAASGSTSSSGFYEYFLEWGRMGRPQADDRPHGAWLRAQPT